MRCETNINECNTITCPVNSDCVDGENTAQCVCHEDKVGENCDKGWYSIVQLALQLRHMGTFLLQFVAMYNYTNCKALLIKSQTAHQTVDSIEYKSTSTEK